MPHIKPFCGILPSREFIDRVIAPPPDLPLEDAGVAALAANPCSFLHLVTPPLGNEFLQGSRETLVYKQAADNLQTFLEKGYLQKDEAPCLYLYSVEGTASRQTGIWAVTLFDDYLNNRVRKHEYTRPDRESSIADYLRQTGIDANPVLIAYKTQAGIEEVITRYLEQDPVLSFGKEGKQHTLRRIAAEEDIRSLTGCFERLSAAYLADGHHRAAALSSYGVERRKFNFKHTGMEEYNFFSSVYFAAESLEIRSFYRTAKDLNGLSVSGFLEKLHQRFKVLKTTSSPSLNKGEFGLYLPGQWYLLSCTPGPAQNDPVARLDVSILQDQLLAPILGINDPRTDARLRFAGADTALSYLTGQVDRQEAAVLFTLVPTSIHELMAVADAGQVMPPKSTWFEPKLDLGILTHYID